MQLLARSTLYWLGIDAKIADYIKRFTIYTQHKATQATQPMFPRDFSDGPWQDLAVDFFTFHRKEHLLICDTFSIDSFIFNTFFNTTQAIQQSSNSYYCNTDHINDCSQAVDPHLLQIPLHDT